jgi:hypothetical protein
MTGFAYRISLASKLTSRIDQRLSNPALSVVFGHTFDDQSLHGFEIAIALSSDAAELAGMTLGGTSQHQQPSS